MSFDFNLFIGIFGIILTIVFGVLSVYLVKRKRYPGSISYIEDQSIGLFKSLVKNFSEINITYKEKSIGQQIALVKGVLINDGSIDINSNMIETNLTANLPPDFKWLSAKIVNQSTGNKSNLYIEKDNVIIFKLELFRRNEFISFEALAEVPINTQDADAGKTLSDNITFAHRISDTDKIKKHTLKLDGSRFWTFKLVGRKLVLPIVSVVYLFMTLYLLQESDKRRILLYPINDSYHSKLFLYADANFNNTIDLIKTNGELYKTISLKEFNKTHTSQVIIGPVPARGFFAKNFKYIISIMLLFCIIISFIPFINYYLDHKKKTNLHKTLNSENPT